jgi:hypothetical protein
VYGLLCPPDRWIYVGESDNIRESLLEHLDKIPSVVGLVWFTFEICPVHERALRRQDLVRSCQPVCNDSEIPETRVPKGLMDRLDEFASRKPLLALIVAAALGAIVGIAVSL